MAGGTWQTQNKVRPGVYVNISSEPRPLGTIGERGTAALPLLLTWGEEGIIELDNDTYLSEALQKLGYYPSDPRSSVITDCLAYAKKLLVYRLNTGTKATVTHQELTATAFYSGSRGNDLKIIIQESIDDEALYDVYTLLEQEVIDSQVVENIQSLQPNGFVTWQGEGELIPTAGINLTGGTDGEITAGSYSSALETFEAYEFNTLGIPTEDTAIKSLASAFIERVRDQTGKKVTAVLYDYPEADYEGIISLKNTIVTSEGITMEPTDFLCRITAMVAAAEINQSLTYAEIRGAIDVIPRLTNADTEKALLNGELVMTAEGGKVFIEQDINTFTSYTPTKGRMFSKNRVMRVLDVIPNDFKRIFKQYYIGKVDNNEDGRNLLKSEIISYLEMLQGLNAIQNFDAQNDLIVVAGQDVDSVYVELYIQPVDAMEKIYMKVTAR